MVPASLGELFAVQVRRYPDRPAVTAGPRTLSYAELDDLAGRVAGVLRRQGVATGTRVGIRADRSADLVVAMLGVLKAGAAYVPVDVRTPAPRADLVFADSGCRAVLVDEVGAPGLAGPAPLVDIGTAAAAPPPDRLPAVDGLHLAYLIYTSGSTGTPKGVMVSHHNVARLFAAARGLELAETDVWTMFHSPAFDFSVWEIWGALLHGGRVVVVPFAVSRSPARFAELLGAQGVTVVSQTPTAFRSLHTELAATGYPALPCRLVVFGGEALDVRSLAPWFDAYGDTTPRLVNMYGITETTVHVTQRPLHRGDCGDRSWAVTGSPIGEPLRDLRARALTADLGEVADGTVGELFVGGAGVAWGYLGRPGLTAERFLPDPDGPPGARMYRTGDLARRAGGELWHLGRGDRQLKLRGFRIEPGEVEHALRGVGARDAAVVVRDARLTAYVVPGPGWAGAEPARAALAGRLPDYLVPAACVEVPALPLTLNGKLDERALPDPADRAASTPPGTESGIARTVAERVLAAAWSRRLGLRTVAPGQNFFALGGDSILALQVVADAAAQGVAVSVEQLLLAPTLGDLVAVAQLPVARGPDGGRIPPFSLLDPADRARLGDPGIADAYPASRLQQGMIFLSELAGDPALYHDLMGMRVRARFDEAALRRALAALSARHPALRSWFDLGRYTEPLQLVGAAVEPVLRVEAVGSALAAAERIRHLRERELSSPIGYDRPPMWSCDALVRPDGRFHLILAVHHALVDGWSFARLAVDLLTEYDRVLAGIGAAGAAWTQEFVAAQPQEFVAAELEAVRSPVAAAFWRDQADVPALLFEPASWPRVVVTDRAVELALDAGRLAGLRRAAAAIGAPLKSVMLACHMWALARCAGRVEDVVSGVVVNGRPERSGADRLVGLFLNTVPLRIPSVDGDWAALARTCFAVEKQARAHRHYPLSEIERRLGRPPFDVSFNFTHFHALAELSGLDEVREVDEVWYADKTTRRLMVEVSIDAPGDAGTVGIRYDSRLVPEEQARDLAAALDEALRAVAGGRAGWQPPRRAGAPA